MDEYGIVRNAVTIQNTLVQWPMNVIPYKSENSIKSRKFELRSTYFRTNKRLASKQMEDAERIAMLVGFFFNSFTIQYLCVFGFFGVAFPTE